MKSIRFLSILYYYPPVLGTAAKRNYSISNAIASKVEAFHILTSSKMDPENKVKPNVSLKTIPAFDYRSLIRRSSKDGALPESTKKSPLMQWSIRFINSFPVNIIAGEGGLVYFFNVIRQGQRIIEKEKITHLYSSYRPFTDHFAASWLKKRNPHLYWIADFRDLIIDPHYQHILFPKSHQVFFKKLFSRADLLTTVSDGLAAHLREYNSNVIRVRNGIEGDILPQMMVTSTHFTISYTGSMFLDKRNAEPLFEALQELIQETKINGSDVRINYAGKDGLYWLQMAMKYRFTSLLDDRGIVSGPEAQAIQQASCINVLLTISSSELQGVLTGKMIEYFKAGSPVLGIIVGQNDPELKSILNDLQIGNSFSDQPDDLEGIKAFIHSEYLHWKETGMNRKPVNMDVLRRRYAVEETMKPLIERVIN